MKQQNNWKILRGFQGVYYLLTGLWPLLHVTSFMEVSGYKTDIWLVKTVGVLILCIGLTQIRELVLKDYSTNIAFLSVTAAIGLFAIDVYYVFNQVIDKIYLADAAVQLLLIGSWLAFFIWRRKD